MDNRMPETLRHSADNGGAEGPARHSGEARPPQIVELRTAGAARGAVFRRLTNEIRGELRLCSALEAQADRLPELCVRCYGLLSEALLRAHRREAKGPARIFIDTLLEDPHGEAADLAAALAQAASDRQEDDTVAFELAEAMQTALAAGRPRNPAALGYLMRSYFEPRRRRIAWEVAAVFEPAKLILSDETCKTLLTRFPAPEQDLSSFTATTGDLNCAARSES